MKSPTVETQWGFFYEMARSTKPESHPMKRPGSLSRRFCYALACAITVAGCATQQSGASGGSEFVAGNPWAETGSEGSASSTWKHQEFPGKRANRYYHTRVDGRNALRVDSATSISMIRQLVRVEPPDFGSLRFSWNVPALITDADLAVRERADSPVRVVLAFEGDRSKFSARDGMLSELAHALTGEPMPYATLMYVWCTSTPPGTVLSSPSTGRIRKLVLESGPANVKQWLDYERDIRADYLKAFGEEPGALVQIGVMTDTDNTESTSSAWYGPVRHFRRK